MFVGPAEGSETYTYGGEIDAVDADEVWRIVQSNPEAFGGPLREGDIVYIGDVYLRLEGDGAWRALRPSELTRTLYTLAASHPDL